jgi:putative heme-binding domain-containing protein
MWKCSTSAVVILSATILLSGTAPAAQQHSYVAQDIEAGRKLYDANCGRCHNADGAGVSGTDLFRQIRRATSDEDIAKLVIAGIPGTSMPSHSFSLAESLQVVAYMRTAAATPSPRTGPATSPGTNATQAARGKAIVEGKGTCLGCHRIRGTGSATGPDLSTIGAPRGTGFTATTVNAASLERALVDPDADVSPAFRVFRVVTRAGGTVRGTLLNQDTFSVQMRDESGELRAFVKRDLREHGFEPSPMPSYRTRLNQQELSDVVSYLLTLKE